MIEANPLYAKKRLYWQCRRGMLELELLLTDFLQYDYECLTLEKKHHFEVLLTVIDPILFDYLMGIQVPEDYGLKDIVNTIRTTTRKRVNA
jgi:antitoxin CptB